ALDAGNLAGARALLERSVSLYADARRRPGGAEGTAGSVIWANEGDAKLLLGDVARDANRPDDAEAKYREARQAFDSATRVDGGYPVGLLGSADAALRIAGVAKSRGDSRAANRAYEEAAAGYRKALGTHSDLSAAHLGLGDVYRETGHHPQAIDSYRRAAMV